MGGWQAGWVINSTYDLGGGIRSHASLYRKKDMHASDVCIGWCCVGLVLDRSRIGNMHWMDVYVFDLHW